MNMKRFSHVWACIVVLGVLAFGQGRPTTEYADAIAKSEEAMQKLVASGTPGASIAVAVNCEVVWSEGFGYADVEAQKKATADTQFGLGSITKALTAALYGKFVEKGLVEWDVPVQRYLPEFPDKEVTARMLAGHTSGLADDFNNANRLTTRHYTTREAMREITKPPLRHAAGTAYYYGTTTYTVLADVLERETGKSFDELMRAELLVSLGMDSTVVNTGPPGQSATKSVFYERTGEGKIIRTPAYDPSFKLAGAGYLSTAADVARFGSAMLPCGRGLSQQVRAELWRPVRLKDGTSPVTGTGESMEVKDTGIALGWNIAEDKNGRRVMHQPGGGPGISSWLVVYPDAGMVVAILSNRTSAPVGGASLQTTLESFLSATSGASSITARSEHF